MTCILLSVNKGVACQHGVIRIRPQIIEKASFVTCQYIWPNISCLPLNQKL